jgi:hypothetical protein
MIHLSNRNGAIDDLGLTIAQPFLDYLIWHSRSYSLVATNRRLLGHLHPENINCSARPKQGLRQSHYAPAAMFQTPQWLGEDDCFDGITVHRTGSLALELPTLRRNHAYRRTALRRATPASLAASTRQMRSMKIYPHPRPLPVLRRVRRFLLSSDSRSLIGYLLSPFLMPHRASTALHQDLETADRAQRSDLVKPLHPIGPIQST